MSKKADTRFRYNLGVYQIRAKIGDTWEQVCPEIGGSLSKCTELLSEFVRNDPDKSYGLFFLEEKEDGSIDWALASSDAYYFNDNRVALQKILHQLNFQMNDQGYSGLANITNISKSSIVNMFRHPSDSRFASVTSEGLIYIKYRVQEHLKGQ